MIKKLAKLMFVTILGLSLFYISCTGAKDVTKSGLGGGNFGKILDYRQFIVYKGTTYLDDNSIKHRNNLLGCVNTGRDMYNKRVWRGKSRRSNVEGTIDVTYDSEIDFKLGLDFFKLSKAALEANNVTKLRFKIIDYTQHTLLDPIPLNNYKKSRKWMRKKFIVALLEAKEIDISLEKKDGTKISVKLAREILKKQLGAGLDVGIGLKVDETGTATFKLKNVFVGFKLAKPKDYL